jgi:glycosyltransferase involved in cell wall biosynthesis
MIGLDENDLFILQPTRVVARKWIERSIEIVRGLKLSNPTLVISHATGDEGDDYYKRITEYAHNMGVHIATIERLISNQQQITGKTHKQYSISDLYQNADIVTYPSEYEGFGNAFLETIYHKKPIIVNRYSIFIADIEPKGFDVLVLNGFVTADVIKQIKNLLHDEQRKKEMVDKNYHLARQFFSYEILEEKLMYLIHTLVCI